MGGWGLCYIGGGVKILGVFFIKKFIIVYLWYVLFLLFI